MLARTRTLAIVGVDAVPVDVEIDIHRGLPAFSLVGLPDAAVREARERVRAALVNCGFDFPLQRITASLAPADLRKAGPGFDLAIATAIMIASERLPGEALERWWLAGELALDGTIRPLPGILAMAERVEREGAGGLAVAAPNAAEAGLVERLAVAPLTSLHDLVALAAGEIAAPPPPASSPVPAKPLPDLADLKGQPSLRRGLEVAAAGGHAALVVGPPGAGKSLAARRLPSILPPLSRREAIEATKIASVAGQPCRDGVLARRPFRAPHHTISPAGLVGGGSPPRPGEITLAHRGVLFLDELGEFARPALEALRQPLEDGAVTISRARGSVRFPASFQLFAAANPCPCGHGDGSPRCSCSADRVRAYAARLSGALADRFDLALAVEQPSAAALDGDPGESSDVVAGRVIGAREAQRERLGEDRTNASMSDHEIAALTDLDEDARARLIDGHASSRLSGRGWTRVIKVARTCADLAGSRSVGADHVDEALSMRRRGAR
ncbi:MAG TPA: YifB family Mg chelatase-like AAA ATPase [Solirubrobacterales bacterium]|nr:YifB family Mg chelatase-like AAA ATPase [Solirubrobacterales bacterium]